MLRSCIHWKDCELFGKSSVRVDFTTLAHVSESTLSTPITNTTIHVFTFSSACHETEILIEPDSVPSDKRLHIGVVGSGPAGMAFAHTAATIGHQVTLFDKSNVIGGT